MLSSVREKIFEAEKKIERLKSEIEINNEKIKASEDNKNRLTLEKEQQKQKSGAYDIRIGEMKEELAVLKATLESHLAETEKVQEQYNNEQQNNEEIKKEAAQVSDRILEIKLNQGKAQSFAADNHP